MPLGLVTYSFSFYLLNIMFVLDRERGNGAIIFHILGTVYFFVLLAVVCNDYFLPSVECVCEDLNISKVIFAICFLYHCIITYYISCIGCCCCEFYVYFNNRPRVCRESNFLVCCRIRCWYRWCFRLANV